ncbi:MAG TPA: DNA alkylation repair protein [Bacillota bacterium]|nr:DNA alkylation repair protein [Bacillota bacterium]
MNEPYFCPNCKTNRSRFNIVQQIPIPVRLDPGSGEVIERYEDHIPDPFHQPYKGPEYKIQCASCGIVQEEDVFINAARHNPRGTI